MAKNWWFKFEFNRWRNDSDLQRCSLEARGFWLEVLCVMYEQDVFQIEGTLAEVARLARCDSSEVAKIAVELQRAEVCDVTLGNGSVTLLSRRLKRELSSKEKTKLRVRKHRGNGHVTLQSNKLEVISKKKKEKTDAAKPASRSKSKSSEETPSSDHSALMAHHGDRIGKIPDGGKQGSAIKWLLHAGYSPKDCIACYDYLLTTFRDKVDWKTVQTNIGEWVARRSHADISNEETLRKAVLPCIP